MKHRHPPLYVARIWDIRGGQPVPTEEIRRRTRAAAAAVAKGRCALPVPILAEVVEIATGEVLEVMYNHAGRAALGLPAPIEEMAAH